MERILDEAQAQGYKVRLNEDKYGGAIVPFNRELYEDWEVRRSMSPPPRLFPPTSPNTFIPSVLVPISRSSLPSSFASPLSPPSLHHAPPALQSS